MSASGIEGDRPQRAPEKLHGPVREMEISEP